MITYQENNMENMNFIRLETQPKTVSICRQKIVDLNNLLLEDPMKHRFMMP